MVLQPRPTKLVVATPNEVRSFGRGDYVHPTALASSRKRLAQWCHDVGGTTWSVSGSDRTALQVGTGTPTSGDGATGAFETQTTGLSSGDRAGRMSGNSTPAFSTLTQRAWAPDFGFRIATGASITNAGFVMGLADADISGTAVPTTNHCAILRYWVGTDGTAFFRAITGDGSALTTTTTTRAFAASTTYEGLIELDPDVPEARFWLTDGSGLWQNYATHQTNLPGSTTALGWLVSVATTASVATGKKVAIDYVKLWQR